VWHGIELLILELVVRTNVDVSAPVLCRVAVSRSGEDCDASAVMLHFITVHTDFMTANDCLQTILLTELPGDIRTELHTDTPLAGPATFLLLRICPEHLHHQTSLSRLPLVVSVEFPNVIQGDVVVGEEATVEHEVLLAHECCQRQCGETLREQLEDPAIIVRTLRYSLFGSSSLNLPFVVLGFALALETIHTVHVVGLVIASVQKEAMRSQPLVGIEQQSNLCRP
jgi:hypothetical protein